MILTSIKEMTAHTVLVEYAKRDCVEKVFKPLKSHDGIDKINVTTEEAMHGKRLIWFVISTLHVLLLFIGTDDFRMTDKNTTQYLQW